MFEGVTAAMAAEKVTEVQLESIRLLETKGRTVSAEPINTYTQVVFEVIVPVTSIPWTEAQLA